MTDRQRTAVVTGASTGIGRAILEALLARGWRVFGGVRKEADASRLREALGETFSPLVFDVTDSAAIARAAETVRSALEGRALNGLVNNAGVAVGGPLRYLPLDELKYQLDVNLYGVLRVTQAFLPLLGADKAFAGPRGRIVNMSSVAGKNAAPFLGPYAMSKHALEALSQSLRRELSPHGVDVAVIGPGAVNTPIWDKADDINAEQYQDTEYYDLLVSMRNAMKTFGDAGLPPKAVGELAADILEGRAKKTRYAVLKNKFMMWTLARLLPDRMVDRIVAKRLGMPKSF